MDRHSGHPQLQQQKFVLLVDLPLNDVLYEESKADIWPPSVHALPGTQRRGLFRASYLQESPAGFVLCTCSP